MTWRTVTDDQGVVWRERRVGNAIERELVSANGPSIVRVGPPPRLIERPRSTTSRSKATLEQEVPELRQDATPKVTIRLGRMALEAIRDELRADGRLIERGSGRMETGGCLITEFAPGGRKVRVIAATWPGGAGRGFDQVRISRALGEQVAARYGDSSIQMAGVWHTHPEHGAWGSQPSHADRANTLAFLDSAQLERFLPFSVDLILSPERSGEMWHPVITGWITRRSDAGSPYTEPAIVEGRI